MADVLLQLVFCVLGKVEKSLINTFVMFTNLSNLCLSCLDLCHVVAFCLLLKINVCPTGPASEVSNPGQGLNL